MLPLTTVANTPRFERVSAPGQRRIDTTRDIVGGVVALLGAFERCDALGAGLSWHRIGGRTVLSS